MSEARGGLIPAEVLNWMQRRQCQEKFRCEKFRPAFLQFDVCPAWLEFSKLNTGIAIPTTHIDKRAGIIKDNYNLVLKESEETTSVNFALLNVFFCWIRPTCVSFTKNTADFCFIDCHPVTFSTSSTLKQNTKTSSVIMQAWKNILFNYRLVRCASLYAWLYFWT